MFTRTIQYVDTTKTEADAERMFAFLRTQVDYRGGRILPPVPGRPDWKVQAFFEDVDVDEKLLPDGCRRVFTPNYLLNVATAVVTALALLAAPPAEARGSGGRSHNSFHVARTSTAHHSLNYSIRHLFGGGK